MKAHNKSLHLTFFRYRSKMQVNSNVSILEDQAMKKMDWFILLVLGVVPVFFVNLHRNWKSRREQLEGYKIQNKKGKEV